MSKKHDEALRFSKPVYVAAERRWRVHCTHAGQAFMKWFDTEAEALEGIHDLAEDFCRAAEDEGHVVTISGEGVQ